MTPKPGRDECRSAAVRSAGPCLLSGSSGGRARACTQEQDDEDDARMISTIALNLKREKSPAKYLRVSRNAPQSGGPDPTMGVTGEPA